MIKIKLFGFGFEILGCLHLEKKKVSVLGFFLLFAKKKFEILQLILR